jgi:hypothetical protein
MTDFSEIMAAVAKLEAAASPLEATCARNIVVVKVGALFGLTPHHAIAAMRTGLRVVREEEAP